MCVLARVCKVVGLFLLRFAWVEIVGARPGVTRVRPQRPSPAATRSATPLLRVWALPLRLYGWCLHLWPLALACIYRRPLSLAVVVVVRAAAVVRVLVRSPADYKGFRLLPTPKPQDYKQGPPNRTPKTTKGKAVKRSIDASTPVQMAGCRSGGLAFAPVGSASEAARGAPCAPPQSYARRSLHKTKKQGDTRGPPAATPPPLKLGMPWHPTTLLGMREGPEVPQHGWRLSSKAVR